MLPSFVVKPVSEFDESVFQTVVPPEHYLRNVMTCIDFESFRPRLNLAYSFFMGRPPIDPVRMLKILFLRFHYRLSDRQVMDRTGTDMSFRWFLGLGLRDEVPNHTNGTHFRQRIGAEGFQQVFQEVVTQARAHGLVNDRLRLKDATHIFADVADVRPIVLVAQVRDALWQAAERLFADTVSQQRAVYETLQQSSVTWPDDERLALRVSHLRDVTAVLQQQFNDLPDKEGKLVQRLQRAVEVASKLLFDWDHPKQGDRLASAMDPDARCGKHGEFYVGYLVDVAMDPVSEIITAVNVLPANGAEAADAVTLIHQEEEAQANKVQGLSIDGIGYNGPVLRELTDPDGLNLDMTVPPKAPRERTTFPSERFPLTVLEDGTTVLTCPAGQTSGPGKASTQSYTTLFKFKAKQCGSCPLREQCLERPASQKGRTVQKNNYQAEYDKVAEKAKTPEYEETRRLHPKVERKLNEVARHHHCRRAQYRGKAKVLVQALMTTIVVNIKRIVKLIAISVPPLVGGLGVRAEPEGV